MFKCEKARRVLLVERARLNMAALLVLAVVGCVAVHRLKENKL